MTAASRPTASFGAHAADYEDEVGRAIAFAGQAHEFYVEAKARRLLKLAERHLGALDGVEALDVGSGTGVTDRFLVDRLGRLQGTDLSPAMLEQAQAANPGVRYERCEPDRLPYPDERFDLVFAICVVHHVAPPERPAFAAELRRVVRPGGLVVVFEHNPWNPLTRLAVRNCALDEDAELLSRRKLRKLAAETGLEVVEDAFLLFTPWRARAFARLDRVLAPVPLGAQYLVAARRR